MVGIYRVDGPNSFTVIADIGAFSIANPPSTAFFVPTGVQYALQPYRGGFLVTDGHHNRVLRVTLDGEITEVIAFDNIVPTGIDGAGQQGLHGPGGPRPAPARERQGRVVHAAVGRRDAGCLGRAAPRRRGVRTGAQVVCPVAGRLPGREPGGLDVRDHRLGVHGALLLRPGQGEQLLFDDWDGYTPPMLGAWSVPIGWAATWLPLLALAGWLIRNEAQWMSSGIRSHARPLLTGLLLGLSLGGIATEPFTVFVLGTETMGLRFTWWALFPLLSVALAMFSAYGAFRTRSLALLGFAVFAALLHVSRFYYLYGTTLMWKSVIMLVVGAGLLFAGAALRKIEPQAGIAS